MDKEGRTLKKEGSKRKRSPACSEMLYTSFCREDRKVFLPRRHKGTKGHKGFFGYAPLYHIPIYPIPLPATKTRRHEGARRFFWLRPPIPYTRIPYTFRCYEDTKTLRGHEDSFWLSPSNSTLYLIPYALYLCLPQRL